MKSEQRRPAGSRKKMIVALGFVTMTQNAFADIAPPPGWADVSGCNVGGIYRNNDPSPGYPAVDATVEVVKFSHMVGLDPVYTVRITSASVKMINARGSPFRGDRVYKPVNPVQVEVTYVDPERPVQKLIAKIPWPHDMLVNDGYVNLTTAYNHIGGCGEFRAELGSLISRVVGMEYPVRSSSLQSGKYDLMMVFVDGGNGQIGNLYWSQGDKPVPIPSAAGCRVVGDLIGDVSSGAITREATVLCDTNGAVDLTLLDANNNKAPQGILKDGAGKLTVLPVGGSAWPVRLGVQAGTPQPMSVSFKPSAGNPPGTYRFLGTIAVAMP